MTLEYKAVTYRSSALPLAINPVSIPVEQKDGVFSVRENEVLVKVRFAALNPVDTILRNTAHPWFSSGQNILGKDYSGDVVAIGAKAAAETSLKVGDRAVGVVQAFSKNGAVGEYVLANVSKKDERAITKLPDGVSYEEAACLPIVLGTAYTAIDKVLKTNKLKKVLVLGAGTSVGRFAVQLLKNVYATEEVVVTCSGRTADAIKAYGATSVIDYTQYKLVLAPVLESVKDTGAFDFVFDCCGNSDLFGNLSTILVPKSEGGAYFTVSGDSKNDYSSLSFLLMLKSNIWAFFRALKSQVNLLDYQYEFFMLSLDKNDLAAIVKFVADGKVKVDIDSVYALEDFQKGVDRQLTGKAVGKILIKI